MEEIQSVIVFIGVLAVLILLTLALGMRERTRTREKLLKRLRRDFGNTPSKNTAPERYAQIPQYYLHHRQPFQIDDITWNDLEMDRLFARMDGTCSAAGEEYLYYLLRTPAMEPSGLPFSQEQYAYFGGGDHEEDRLRLQEILTGLGHAGRYSLYDYIDLTLSLGERSSLPHYAAAAAPFAAFALMFWHTGIGLVAMLLVFAVNLMTYFRIKSGIAPHFQVFSYILRLLDCAQEIKKADCPAFREDTEKIPALVQDFAGFRRGSSLLLGSAGGGSDPLGIILDYVRILFHLDLIKFNSMLGQLRGRQAQIGELLTITGRIDACISIASWRETLMYHAVPAWEEGEERRITEASADQGASPAEGRPVGMPVSSGSGAAAPVFLAEDLFHPLLEAPVANSITAEAPILLTGSNASGKSTFLKAAALCALLAQSVGIAPARRYCGGFYQIFTSMALRDSLQDGESYFIVEIKSLRRILEAGAGEAGAEAFSPAMTNVGPAEAGAVESALTKESAAKAAGQKRNPPVLCCIDEVLRGTNTVERIAASAEILRCFAQTGTLCFAATHDLELTSILADLYENYHFSEEIEGGDVRFSYKLLPGASASCNAIALLGSLGYDRTLVDRAQERADRFLKKGQWVPEETLAGRAQERADHFLKEGQKISENNSGGAEL